MPASKIAFFGATGDCAGFTLANTLKAGYDCIALARTPAKLTESMKNKGVNTTALDQHLTIIQGDVKDVEAVKSALQLNGQVVDTIVCGIGGSPQLQWSLWTPVTLNDPHICQDAGNTILKALQQLKPATKPLLIYVSTTGIPPNGMPRDEPLLFTPLYRWMLHVPHVDKRALENDLAAHVNLPESQKGIRAFVAVKASLLMDGDGRGLEAVRQGVPEKPAVGYTIRRQDVGLFICERLVKQDVREDWLNKGISITY
jgi:hypothetical protein